MAGIPDVKQIDGLDIHINSVSADSISLSINNTSTGTYGYGATFRLEKRFGRKTWSKLSPIRGAVWFQEDWFSYVRPGETSSISYKWDWYYGCLSSGDYRILVLLREEGHEESFMLSAEFSI